MPLLADVLYANTQFGLPHDASPDGTNPASGWYTNSQAGQLNNPGLNTAMLGWGHYYNAVGATSPDRVAIRNMQVFICHGSSHRWTRYSHGNIYGEEYTDFATDTHFAAELFVQSRGESVTRVANGHAFHWWPNSGRFLIPTNTIHGILVVCQGKLLPTPGNSPTAEAYVFGVGADYWIDLISPWAPGFVNNPGVGVGQLKFLTTEWSWHVMSTATDEDINLLYEEGFS